MIAEIRISVDADKKLKEERYDRSPFLSLNIVVIGGAALLFAGLSTARPIPYAQPDRSGIVEGNHRLERIIESSIWRESLAVRQYEFTYAYGDSHVFKGSVAALSPKMALANGIHMSLVIRQEQQVSEIVGMYRLWRWMIRVRTPRPSISL